MFNKIKGGFQKFKAATLSSAPKSTTTDAAAKPALSKKLSTDRQAKTSQEGVMRKGARLASKLTRALPSRSKEQVDSKKLVEAKAELEQLVGRIKEGYLGHKGRIQKTPEYQTLKEALKNTEKKMDSFRTQEEVSDAMTSLRNAQELADNANATTQGNQALGQELGDQIKSMQAQLEAAKEADKGLISSQIDLLSRAQKTLEADPSQKNIELAKNILNLARY